MQWTSGAHAGSRRESLESINGNYATYNVATEEETAIHSELVQEDHCNSAKNRLCAEEIMFRCVISDYSFCGSMQVTQTCVVNTEIKRSLILH
jgi:hypothetical protein